MLTTIIAVLGTNLVVGWFSLRYGQKAAYAAGCGVTSVLFARSLKKIMDKCSKSTADELKEHMLQVAQEMKEGCGL